MSGEQRMNNSQPGNQNPANHSNNNNNNTTANANNNNNNMNPAAGMPLGMHAMQQGLPAGLQAGLQASMAGAMQAGMSGAMQAGMPGGLQANMPSGMRSPVSQVQLIHSPLPGPPYHLSQFPYNQQIMLQNAAVQAAMQAQMNQQLNLAMQGRPPSVSPKSPSLPVLSPSPSSSQASASMSGPSTSSPSSIMSTAGGCKVQTSKAGNNGNQAQVAAMMAGKATMIPRQAPQPIVISQIGVVPGQPVSTAGFLPQGCDPSQLINSHAQQLRLTSQQQLVTSTGQIITSQPMLTNQAVLQAMANLQQGIPFAPQPLLGHQTSSLIPSQPLFIRPAGHMQPQQSMMAIPNPNVQAVNSAMKNQKSTDMSSNSLNKPFGIVAGKSPANQGRNLTILPSTSRPGLTTARVYPTSLQSTGQATKLNIPQVTPKLSKQKPRSHSSKSQSSTGITQTKTTTTTTSVSTKSSTTTTSATNGARTTPSKSQSESESDASKKASPCTPPDVSVPLAADLPKSKTTETTNTTTSLTDKKSEGELTTSAPGNTDTVKVVAMEVDKFPEAKKEVVVEKQRAIVKPHILTHVIEGFIIQEGPEPFPVQRSSLLTDFIPPKHNNINADSKDSEDDQSPYAFRDPTPDEMLGQNSQESGQSVSMVTAPSPILKCEFCGKMAKAEMFRCSKRFCSTTCAKRYNVSCTRRLGLFRSSSVKDGLEQQKHLLRSVSMPASRSLRKRKPSGLRMRRNWRSGRGGRMSFNSISSPTLDDNSSSRSEHESSSSVGSPSPPQELEMETDDPTPQTSPKKWTVQDVYDFIKSITSCSTYAEEFRAQEIDGQALLLLKEDHLMTTMNMKLGPALKICARINSLKDDYV